MRKKFIMIGCIMIAVGITLYIKKEICYSPLKQTTNNLLKSKREKNKKKVKKKKATKELFYQKKISDKLFQRIYQKSYKKNCTIAKEELRYIKVLYIGFDGETHTGELIVNQKIASDVIHIFYELYQQKYPIEKIKLIDTYEADDEQSMSDNNSSCFNFRTIKGSDKLSNHSKGLAIDINPLYNPCVKTEGNTVICQPANGIDYIDREKNFPYKITEEDICYQIFEKYGFSWGGHWNHIKDYQHFEKTTDF